MGASSDRRQSESKRASAVLGKTQSPLGKPELYQRRIRLQDRCESSIELGRKRTDAPAISVYGTLHRSYRQSVANECCLF